MKSKIVIMVALLMTLIYSQGCASYGTGKQTGIAYIMTQAKGLDSGRGISVVSPEPTQSGQQQTQPQTKPQTQPQTVVDRKVYLTFDDGPNFTNTPLVLDILDSYGVKATFFVVGTNIEKNPNMLRDIVKRGHAVGNHTYNHKYRDVYAGADSFLNSIQKNDELIFKITGQRPRVVRDPGGEVRNNQGLKNLLAQKGYRLIDWNVDSYDSRKTTLEGADIVENIRLQMVQRQLWPNMVILMHDGTGHLNTVRALPTVIEMLQSQGFKFEILK